MGIKEISSGRSDIFWVDPRALNVKPGWNVRVAGDEANKAHVESIALAVSSEFGVQRLDPLTVFNEGGVIYVSDGHCRLAGVMLAISRGVPIVSVPVKTEPRGTTEADWSFSQAARNAGKPLTPFEFGLWLKRQMAYGWTVERIAAGLGKSVQAVHNALDLQEAPAAVRKLVQDSRVSATLAIETLRREGPSAASATLCSAVDAAAQEGKAKATARHIGKGPKLPRVQKMTRVRDIIENAETNDDRPGETWLLLPDVLYRELCGLLGI